MIVSPIQFTLDTLYSQDIVSRVNTSLALLYTTRVGTMPLSRDFGLDFSFLDKPTEVAKSMLVAELCEKTARFVPEARVKEVTFSPAEPGVLVPKVVITLV